MFLKSPVLSKLLTPSQSALTAPLFKILLKMYRLHSLKSLVFSFCFSARYSAVIVYFQFQFLGNKKQMHGCEATFKVIYEKSAAAMVRHKNASAPVIAHIFLINEIFSKFVDMCSTHHRNEITATSFLV